MVPEPCLLLCAAVRGRCACARTERRHARAGGRFRFAARRAGDGWCAGVAYTHPSLSDIDNYYVYRTRTVLDGTHFVAGLFASLGRSTELDLGISYSLTAKWHSPFLREGGYHAAGFTIRIGCGL